MDSTQFGLIWCPLDFGFWIGNGRLRILDVIHWFGYLWSDLLVLIPLVGYLILDKLS